ncbi:MAG TPA: ankyrin repeat domain-containing protein, partial [Tetrasphaera sp.]|nr:ankyrin repeat domain-containing protein [Tetrasphaera sp.]
PDELTTVQVLIAGGVQLDRPSETEGLTPVQMARDRGYRTLERALAAAAAHDESSTPVADLRAAVAAGDADAAALALRDGASRELPAAELAALVGSAQGQGHREVHRLLTSYLGV